MTRAYRASVFGKPLGPWRERRADALQDAVDVGQASVDEHTGTVYLTVPAKIIDRELHRRTDAAQPGE